MSKRNRIDGHPRTVDPYPPSGTDKEVGNYDGGLFMASNVAHSTRLWNCAIHHPGQCYSVTASTREQSNEPHPPRVGVFLDVLEFVYKSLFAHLHVRCRPMGRTVAAHSNNI